MSHAWTTTLPKIGKALFTGSTYMKSGKGKKGLKPHAQHVADAINLSGGTDAKLLAAFLAASPETVATGGKAAWDTAQMQIPALDYQKGALKSPETYAPHKESIAVETAKSKKGVKKTVSLKKAHQEFENYLWDGYYDDNDENSGMMSGHSNYINDGYYLPNGGYKYNQYANTNSIGGVGANTMEYALMVGLVMIIMFICCCVAGVIGFGVGYISHKVLGSASKVKKNAVTYDQLEQI